VQTTLLGLATAIILALVAALVAPLVVDWNSYRAAFEDEASRLTGLPVRVNGKIDASILPTPRVKLRDVEVGNAGGEPCLRAGIVELELGLGPLLRGEVQATELRLVSPQIRLGLDSAGAVDWPAPSPSFQADALAISRFTVEDGQVIFSDAASGSHLALRKLSFDGDIRSFLGPFRGEGTFALGDERYGYRIAGGRVDDDGGLKLRIDIDPSNYPLTTEIDGTLSFERGVPHFDGALSLARPAGAALADGERVMSDPWQLAGKVRATPSSASLRDLALQYGPEERAVNFNGTAEFTFGERPHLNGEILARQVDVDRVLAAPDLTHRPPLALLKSFLEAFVGSVNPPMPVGVSVAIDAVTVGGTAIQSLHGNVRYDDKGWSVDDFAFRAPGFAEVNVSGKFGGGPQSLAFSGPASIDTSDLKKLMGWLEGRGEQISGPAQSFTAHGDLTVASNHFALDRLSASLDQEKVDGRFAYSWAAGKRPASLDGELHAPKLDIDALTAFADAVVANGALEIPHDVALILDVGDATFAGFEARGINARVKVDAGILHIDRLSISDLGGAALDINGRIDELSSQPRGRLTLGVDATTFAGLANIVGKFAPQVADPLRPFVDRLAPAKVHGVLTIDRAGTAGSTARLDLGGTLGALRLTLNGEASGQPAYPAAAALRVNGRFDADDGGALVRLLGLDRVVAVDQLPGQLTIAAGGQLNGDLNIKGLATAGGFSAVVEGKLNVNGSEAPTGSLQLKLSAADLRPLRRAMTGQPGLTVPISATAIVGIAGADVSVTDLAMTAGKASVHGRLDLKLSSPISVAGDIAADDVDAAAVAAMLLGLPSVAANAAKPWSSAPVGAGGFAAATGSVNFKFDRAALTPSLIARDLKGVVQLQPPRIGLRGIDGSLAGGRLTGDLTFRHDSPALSAQGHVELANANAAAIAGTGGNAVEGLLTAKLQGESLELSPEGLVGSFHGTGTVALSKAQFGGIDPAAFDAAIRLADQSGAIDAAKIRAAVGSVMDNGRFAVPKGEAGVTIAGGQIHLTNAQLRAPSGAELLLGGTLDLNNTAIDVQMTLSGQPATDALIPARPELAMSVKGPLGAAEKKLDIATLVGWLTLRATEQQTRRLESLEVSRRLDVFGPAVRPAWPPLRSILLGTQLEITTHANTAPPPGFGASRFDRLRPEIPVAAPASSSELEGGGAAPTSGSEPDGGAAAAALPASSPSPVGIKPVAPRTAPGADNPTETAPPTQQAPKPAARSLFDLLFRSKN